MAEMTLSRTVIPKETEDNLSLWDLPIVSEGDTPTVVPRAEKCLPTADDIDQIQEQARAEAYDEAFPVAKKEGFDKGHEEGYKEGFELGKSEGYSHGLSEAETEVNEKITHFSQLISALSNPLESLDEEVEHELMSLSMLLARHLVRRELKLDPSHVIAAVREAVELLPISARNIRVFLHPDDAILVRDALSVNEDEELRWNIVEDPIISRGGCNVESEYSRIDATVESKLNTVIAQVLGDEREQENVTAPEQSESDLENPSN